MSTTDDGRPIAASACRRCISAFDQAQELAIRESEARIAAMTETFLDWAVKNAARLGLLLDHLSSGEAPPTAIAEMQGILHNLKGQGGTFGFALLSAVAESACAYLRGLQGEAPNAVTLRHHVTAVETIIGRRVQGDGGALGERLLARLRAIRVGSGERSGP